MDTRTSAHRVTVRLTYREIPGRDPIPYKWRGDCTCGWGCISWQWVAEDRYGGALIMTLEHLGLTPGAAL